MSKITWKEIDELELMGMDYYGLLREPEPSRVLHLLSIQIEELEPGNLSPLVSAAIHSLRKEVQNLRTLLRGEHHIKVLDNYRATAGRFRLTMEDRGSGPFDLSVNHHLRTYPSEEGPGHGQWTDDFDWEVVHAGDCTANTRFDDLCPFITEIEYGGRDAFGDPSDWPEPPFEMRVRHVVHESPAGPWGGAEWDVYIEQDPEEEAP